MRCGTAKGKRPLRVFSSIPWSNMMFRIFAPANFNPSSARSSLNLSSDYYSINSSPFDVSNRPVSFRFLSFNPYVNETKINQFKSLKLSRHWMFFILFDLRFGLIQRDLLLSTLSEMSRIWPRNRFKSWWKEDSCTMETLWNVNFWSKERTEDERGNIHRSKFSFFDW